MLEKDDSKKPVACEAWESLAWALCAAEHGEDACNELLYAGGPIPEPLGDRWMQYEGEAKRLIELVHKHTTPPQRAQKPVIQAAITRTPMGGLVSRVLWIDDKLEPGDYTLYTAPQPEQRKTTDVEQTPDQSPRP